jgi:hypothetical protein
MGVGYGSMGGVHAPLALIVAVIGGVARGSAILATNHNSLLISHHRAASSAGEAVGSKQKGVLGRARKNSETPKLRTRYKDMGTRGLIKSPTVARTLTGWQPQMGWLHLGQ